MCVCFWDDEAVAVKDTNQVLLLISGDVLQVLHLQSCCWLVGVAFRLNTAVGVCVVSVLVACQHVGCLLSLLNLCDISTCGKYSL